MLLFVYGTLKNGNKNHSRLDNSKFIAKGSTASDIYSTYDRNGYKRFKNKYTIS